MTIINKDIIIDAIAGKGFAHLLGYTPNDMVSVGLANFTGNQWNENWEWNKTELKQLTIEELNNLYVGILPKGIMLEIETNKKHVRDNLQSFSKWWAERFDNLLFEYLSKKEPNDKI